MSNYTKSTNFATKDNLSPGDPLKIVRGTEIDTEFNNISTAISTKTDNSAAAITGGSITGITDLAIADGGTGASTATAALNNLLPSQTGNGTKYLQTDGSNATWDAVSLSTSDITGTLGVANGGTGVTSSTGTGNVVLSNSPTLVTPALGIPASGTATNLTGLPISTGVSGLGTGVATFLGTPSSANLASAVSDETGSGALVFANSPTLVTPALGTPSALVGTNITGTASGLTAGNVTTNANLTGAVTSVGNASSLGSFTSAQLATALTDETGSGANVFATSPTLVTPVLGTPTSATLTNATGLPLTTGVTGTLPTANGGTNLTSFTSGGVVYASSTSALATGSALVFDGTNLGVGMTPTNILDITKTQSASSWGAIYNGDTTASGAAQAGFKASNAAGAIVQIYVRGANATTDSQGVSGNNAALLFNTQGTIAYNTASLGTSLRFVNNTSEVVRFDASGNVGIGTSSPSAKLQVGATTDSLNVAKVTVSSSGIGYLGVDSSGTNGVYLIANNSGSTQTGVVTGGLGLVGQGAYPLVFGTNSTERMRLDSAGNLGLGVTPSASWTDFTVFQNKEAAILGYGGQTHYSQNAYYQSGTWKYISSSIYATRYSQLSGSHSWWRSTSTQTAGTDVVFTQALTLHASGGLSLGNTSDPGATNLSVSGTASAGIVHRGGSYTAGATTPSVTGITYMPISNSSATTITNFTGGVTGQILYLLFNDANTTINRNNARLAGSANFTSAQFATLSLLFNGSEWIEVCRSTTNG